MTTTKVKKSSTANTGKYAYSYSDLATIHEELERQKITYYQFIDYDEKADADYIYTVITKEGKDESPRRGCRVILGQNPNPAQAQGSGVTYARRYSLLMALGWATEDDDAASVLPGTQQARKSEIDFETLKAELAKIDALEPLFAHFENTQKKYSLTERQLAAVKKIYSERKIKIKFGKFTQPATSVANEPKNDDRDYDLEADLQREAELALAAEKETANYEARLEMQHGG